MKLDPSYELTEAIKTALIGNASYNDRNYPVQIGISKDYPLRYVQINYPELVDEGTKDKFMADGTIQILIVNRNIASKPSSEQEMANIMTDINNILVKASITMTTFYLSPTMYVTAFSTVESTEDQEGIRREKQITYSFKIIER